jgi:Polyketide cyclase / dehydrase and lipid transport
MARTEAHIAATPQAVFDVLSNPRSYGYWVVGSRKIRSADGDWPKVGTAFDHSVGAGPLVIRDYSYVEEVDAPRYLQLRVKARPFGTARVKMELVKSGAGTDVTMIEDPADRASAFIFNPLTHLAVRIRNGVALRRLEKLATGEHPLSEAPLPPRGPDAQDPADDD